MSITLLAFRKKKYYFSITKLKLRLAFGKKIKGLVAN